MFHHAGIKIPFFAFFSHDSGIRVKEAPTNMLVAMAIAAFLCIFLAFPVFGYKVLYEHAALPATDYNPYTFAHVNGQFLLLLFSALAFTLLLLSGLYPAEKRAINLDADWFYRKGGVLFYNLTARILNGINTWTRKIVVDGLIGRLSDNARIGPVRLAAHVMTVYWNARGLDRRRDPRTPRAAAGEREDGQLPDRHHRHPRRPADGLADQPLRACLKNPSSRAARRMGSGISGFAGPRGRSALRAASPLPAGFVAPRSRLSQNQPFLSSSGRPPPGRVRRARGSPF